MARKSAQADKIKQYIASVETRLAKATGKTMAQWVRVAKKCPHIRPADRLRWLRSEHGLPLSHAGIVLGRAFGLAALETKRPAGGVDQLFSGKFLAQKPVFEAVVAWSARLGSGTTKIRRGYVGLHRLKQYAAVKPSRRGLLLGLALKKYPKSSALREVKALGGCERIRRALVLEKPKDFDKNAKALLRQAYSEA